MKKLICILASAALLGACEQSTEVTPASPPEKSDKPVDPNTFSRKTRPATTPETKTETTTTTTASPSP